MIPRLGHVLETCLYVDDLARAETFYREVMGLERLFADSRMVALAVPGEMVLLLFRRGRSDHPSAMPGGVIPGHDASGRQHVCFAIPWGEQEAWSDHLGRAGVPIESRIVWPRGGTSLYFRDPDGHSLEVATPGLWVNR